MPTTNIIQFPKYTTYHLPPSKNSQIPPSITKLPTPTSTNIPSSKNHTNQNLKLYHNYQPTPQPTTFQTPQINKPKKPNSIPSLKNISKKTYPTLNITT